MPYPRHVLQSVEMPAVTQVRASDDHVPGANYNNMQWRIGYSSLLAWALAIAPFKDNYWSTTQQPGSSCGNSLEISPALQEAISVFSAGPVSPGDGVGFSDVALIMRACTTGGRLLQPSRAATAIDSAIINRAFPSASTAKGEIYATYSLVSGWAWDSVLAAQVNASYTLTPSDLAPIRADAAVKDDSIPAVERLRYGASGAPKAGDLGTLAYSINSTTFDISTLTVQPFSASSPIAIKTCGEWDFQVWHTAPIFANGIAVSPSHILQSDPPNLQSTTYLSDLRCPVLHTIVLCISPLTCAQVLGDVSKFIPMAPARVAHVGVGGPTVTLSLVGEVGEAVPITWWTQPNGVKSVTCNMCADGTAALVLPAGSCQCL